MRKKKEEEGKMYHQHNAGIPLSEDLCCVGYIKKYRFPPGSSTSHVHGQAVINAVQIKIKWV